MLQFYLKKMFLLFYFAVAFSVCEADEYKFSLTRSSDWTFIGRCVKYTLTMTIPESTDLKAKIKLPFNGTAILRITEAKITHVSEHLTYTGNSTNMTSSADDGLIDIALFDFGTVTRASYDNDTKIKIEFKVQVMNHVHVVNGGIEWVSVGVQYSANQSIWAAMLAVKTVETPCKRPVLKVDLKGVPPVGHSVLFGDQISFRLIVAHSCHTTDTVESGTVELPLPSFLTYHSNTPDSGSVSLVVSDTASAVSIAFGALQFAEKVDVTIKLNLDPSKARADWKIHDGTVHVNLKYTGSADTCASPSGSREFAHEGPATASFKYYVKGASCDEPLGMESGSIADAQITASSYATDREPAKGRLNGAQAWIPNGPLAKEKSQFLQVNFTSKVKVHRVSTQGHGEKFVTSLSLFFSDDGVIWKPYKEGSKIKEFAANTNADSAQMIALSIPIEAMFIRINPNGWHKGIALKAEFYGCTLSQQPASSDALKFTGRGYLLNKATNTMYVCSVPMKSTKSAQNCFYSSDQGDTWTGMDNRLLVLLGHDTVENKLFGVSKNGKAILKSAGDDHSARFNGVPQNDWSEAKAKPTTTHTKWLESDMAITNTTNTPNAYHTVTSDSGTIWGASPNGIHVKLPDWELKAIWMCTAFGK